MAARPGNAHPAKGASPWPLILLQVNIHCEADNYSPILPEIRLSIMSRIFLH